MRAQARPFCFQGRGGGMEKTDLPGYGIQHPEGGPLKIQLTTQAAAPIAQTTPIAAPQCMPPVSRLAMRKQVQRYRHAGGIEPQSGKEVHSCSTHSITC